MGRKFKGTLHIYPRFYQYVSLPMLPKIPGRDEGISVAAYAVYHALGHLLFARMSYEGRLDIIGSFLAVAGWTKHPDANAERGHFFDYDNRGAWRYRKGAAFQTEASKYSPADDFAESFALYMSHPGYLSLVFPDKHRIVDKALAIYGV